MQAVTRQACQNINTGKKINSSKNNKTQQFENALTVVTASCHSQAATHKLQLVGQTWCPFESPSSFDMRQASVRSRSTGNKELMDNTSQQDLNKTPTEGTLPHRGKADAFKTSEKCLGPSRAICCGDYEIKTRCTASKSNACLGVRNASFFPTFSHTARGSQNS